LRHVYVDCTVILQFCLFPEVCVCNMSEFLALKHFFTSSATFRTCRRVHSVCCTLALSCLLPLFCFILMGAWSDQVPMYCNSGYNSKREPKHNDRSKVKPLDKRTVNARGVKLCDAIGSSGTFCHSPTCDKLIRHAFDEASENIH
jgi:hypothetical protein